MTKVYSHHKLETFQILGETVRAHWNFEVLDPNPEYEDLEQHRCDEAVFSINDTREQIVAIIEALNGPAIELADEWEKLINA
jgi:hypothetical protein